MEFEFRFLVQDLEQIIVMKMFVMLTMMIDGGGCDGDITIQVLKVLTVTMRRVVACLV